jgi:hypothetical protein
MLLPTCLFELALKLLIDLSELIIDGLHLHDLLSALSGSKLQVVALALHFIVVELELLLRDLEDAELLLYGP